MGEVNRVGRAFSSLPFDGIDNVANISLHDDFLTTTEAADTTSASGVVIDSELQWVLSESTAVTGATGLTQVAGVANHPGIVRLTTPADAGDTMHLTLAEADADGSPGTILLDDNGIYIASLVRINDIDAVNFGFGLIGQAPAKPNSSAADVVGFAFEDADTTAKFLAQINTSGQTDVEEAIDLTYVESDWVLLELYATDADAYFRATTEDGYKTVHIADSMPTTALVPSFDVEDVGGAGDTVDIDAFHLRYQRQPLVANTDVAWLGQ